MIEITLAIWLASSNQTRTEKKLIAFTLVGKVKGVKTAQYTDKYFLCN